MAKSTFKDVVFVRVEVQGDNEMPLLFNLGKFLLSKHIFPVRRSNGGSRYEHAEFYTKENAKKIREWLTTNKA